MTDFVARRQAALEAEREQRLEWEAEDEFEHEQMLALYEFEDRIERDRTQRRRYREAMVAKKLRAPANAATDDEAILDRIEQQQLAAQDPGEPD